MRRRGAALSLETCFARLLELSPAERARALARLSPLEAEAIYYDWSLWRRPDQHAPEGDWLYWLILAGRGAGKTRAGAETVRSWARDYPFVNLIGATRHDAREIMVTGESGLLAVCPPSERPTFARASDRLEWPNGAVSQIFSAEEPDRLRGKQHMKRSTSGFVPSHEVARFAETPGNVGKLGCIWLQEVALQRTRFRS